MAQAGLNMGPRHARVFGKAKSFTKTSLSTEQMICHDEDVIGAASLFWAIAQAVLPTEVLSVINEYMDSEKLPSIQTRNVGPGKSEFICESIN